MRLGVVILPEYPWREGHDIWRRAEALGFDHAWTYDHLAWRELRESTWFSAIPTLTAAALATERIRLGPLVASPNFRHPVPFAKELMTLDDVSNGRLTLGIGSGGVGWDATVLGEEPWTPRERADRFAEFVEITDRVLREPETSYEGRYYSADGATTHPGCIQRPRVPFAVAATGPRAMQLAARYADTWVTTGDRGPESTLAGREGAAAVRRQIDMLEAACSATGRDPASVGRLVLSGISLDSGLGSPAEFADTIGHYAASGCHRLRRPLAPVRPPLRRRPFDLRERDRERGAMSATALSLHPWNLDFEWELHRGPFRRLSAAQAEQFDELGFVVIEDAVDAATLAQVTEEIDGFEAEFEDALRSAADGRAFIAEADAITFTTHLVARSRTVRDLATGDVFLGLCADLVGPDVNMYWDQAVYKKPEKPRRFPWHQDNGYTFIEPQQYLTCWLALTDATEQNGCPWIAPGVHKHGTLAHQYVDPLGFECFAEPPTAPVPTPVRAGSALVFSSLTPHMTGPNRTDAVRKAYILQYAPAGAQVLRGDPRAGAATERVACDEPTRQFPVLRGGKDVSGDRP